MEQLINAATMPYWATILLFILGGTFWGVIILIFFIDDGDVKKYTKTIVTLSVAGTILLASSLYFKNIYSKYNNQAKSIAKDVIAKEYPDATEFRFNLDTGYFTENNIEYKVKYQKTISNEEKLIVTVKDELFKVKDKSVKMLDIPKELKSYEPIND